MRPTVNLSRWMVLPLVLGLLMLPTSGIAEQDLPLKMRANGGHPSDGETSIVNFTINSWSSAAEHESMLKAAASGDDPIRGNTVVRDALQASDSNGRMAFQGELGIDIRYAHEVAKNGGRTIVLAADRPIDAEEASNLGSLSLDYNVTVAVIELDEDGAGAGSLWAAASISLGPDGLFEPTGADAVPIRLGRVRILN